MTWRRKIGVPAIFFGTIWLGLSSLQRVAETYTHVCGERRCPSLSDEYLVLGFGVFISAFALAMLADRMWSK